MVEGSSYKNYLNLFSRFGKINTSSYDAHQQDGRWLDFETSIVNRIQQRGDYNLAADVAPLQERV